MKKIDTLKKIIPLADRILIKVANNDGEQKNKFGIIIPDTVEKEKSAQGQIMAIGEGARDESGKIIPSRLKVGQIVLFSKYNYDEITVNNEEYILVKEENILAILK